jgi:L-ectoine synthase
MIVRTIDQIKGTDREVVGVGFISQRLILAKDNMGFSFHQTIIPKGDPHNWCYKNHLESCYCIEGFGILKNLDDGSEYEIKPGTIYILNNNDNHLFQAIEDTILISVFNPPIKGSEIHKEDGSYDI